MQQQLNILRALRRLRLPVFFERSLRQARKQREKEQRAEANMLLWDYQTELEYYDFIASPKRGERTNLQAVTDKLDQFFIAEKLKQACLAHSRFLANQEEYEIQYLDAILDDLHSRPELFKVPAITIYASCYQAVVAGGTEQDFLRLRKVMERFRDYFPNTEIRDIYLLAINYCIRCLNNGPFDSDFGASVVRRYLCALIKSPVFFRVGEPAFGDRLTPVAINLRVGSIP